MNNRETFIVLATSFIEFLKLCKVNDANLGTVIFEVWPHLIELAKLFKKERNIIVLKARQLGVSTLLALYALWKVMTCPGFNCLILSAGEKPAARLLDKAKFAYTHLPDWLKTSIPFGKWSETELTFPVMNSRIVALPSTESPSIGESSSLVIMDEHDYHAYPESDFAAAEPTASAGGQIICVSTSDKTKPNSLFKTLCRQAMEGVNNFKFHFIGWSSRPKRDDEWLERERLSYIGREDEFDENYPSTPEQALSPVSARSFFNTDVLKSLIDKSTEPLETKFGFVFVYSKFQPKILYGGGADISQGVGKDYQACVILGKRGFSVEDVAYIHANDLSVKTYAYYTAELGKEYNYPLLAGESNSMGLSYLQELQELGYQRLYFRDEKRQQLGWATTNVNQRGNVGTRDMVLVDLAQALADGLLIIRYKPLLLQLLDFQRLEGRSGKIEFKSVGKHDDLVMACAIAFQMIKNKSHGATQPQTRLVETITGGMYS